MTTRRNRGSRHWIPVHRRMALDIARIGLSTPSFPVHRTMQLAVVEEVRKAAKVKIGWTALIIHAYGTVEREMPELRELYVSLPFAYLYRHPEPVAAITISRLDEAANERLIWGRIPSPDEACLQSLQHLIHNFTTVPIKDVFRDGLELERLPSLVRRFLWWLLIRWSGRRKAKKVGTFTVSSLGGFGAVNSHHPLITTTSLAMGPMEEDGSCEMVLICDHRVIDGLLAARALQRMEEILKGEVLEELRKLG